MSKNPAQHLVTFCSGEEEGFNYYFRLYYKPICYFINRYLNDLPAAEDIASEGFLKLWAHRQKIQSETHLRNWLYRAVYHLCLDELEKIKTRQKHKTALQANTETIENDFTTELLKTEMLRMLYEAIDQLPAQCKRIFYKIYIEGKTTRETAVELELAISTVDNQKTRGLKLLRGRLGRES